MQRAPVLARGRGREPRPGPGRPPRAAVDPPQGDPCGAPQPARHYHWRAFAGGVGPRGRLLWTSAFGTDKMNETQYGAVVSGTCQFAGPVRHDGW